MKYSRLKLLIVAHLVGCVALGVSQRAPISLEKVNQVLPGQTSKSALTKLLGKPDEVFKGQDKKIGQSWKYREKDRDRVTFYFEDGSDVASSWRWDVFEGDSEQSLKLAMAKFPGATWEAETSKWINPHAFPSECYYKDKKMGLSIEFHLRRKEVFSISRSDPNRKIASDEKEKPPSFCIDGSCSPGIPATEFFKGQSVWKYCEETK